MRVFNSNPQSKVYTMKILLLQFPVKVDTERGYQCRPRIGLLFRNLGITFEKSGDCCLFDFSFRRAENDPFEIILLRMKVYSV